MACISLSIEYGISISDIKVALSKFTGAHRRFEYKGKIDKKASVYDDYGHHPTEIKATANSLKNKKYHESWVIFQPHTYSRTFNLLNDFANYMYLDTFISLPKDEKVRIRLENEKSNLDENELVEKKYYGFIQETLGLVENLIQNSFNGIHIILKQEGTNIFLGKTAFPLRLIRIV